MGSRLDDERFPFTSRWNPDREVNERGRLAICQGVACKTAALVPDNHVHGMNPVGVAKKLRRAGWYVSTNMRTVLCHNCNPEKPAMKSAQTSASTSALAQAMTAPVVSPTVEPPRLSTVEDRRRIADELEAAWNVTRGCYHKDGSDQRLAEKLSVPRAWVTDMRVMLCGPEDRNEMGAMKLEELDKIRRDLDTLDLALLESFEKGTAAVDAMRKRVEKALAA